MTEPIGNHLWQSTIVVAIAALLAVVLRPNRAHVRYWLWMIASLKFIVPFSAVVLAVQWLGWHAAVRPARREVFVVIDAVSQPFSRPDAFFEMPIRAALAAPGALSSGLQVAALTIWAAGTVFLLLIWFVRWRRVAAAVRAADPVLDGAVLATLRRLESRVGQPRSTPLVSSETMLEPGVFGIVKPVLLWPRQLEAHLSERQIEAILVHELAHIRRRDNLAAFTHMAVQAVFWFYPLVWWVGSRLMDERERACDDEVIGAGSDRQAYAEGVLKTCQFYLQSPLPCVSGVTGSDLKLRIESIMRLHRGEELAAWKKLLLGTFGLAAIVVPLFVGGRYVPLLRANVQTTGELPAFEVASVKPNRSNEMGGFMRSEPGGRVTITNNTLRNIVRNAYQLQDFQIVGGPDWLGSERFDILAKAENDIPRTPLGAVGPLQLMIRRLLAERFQLAAHTETRELPIFALVLARQDGRLGRNLTPAAVDCKALAASSQPPPPPNNDKISCGARFLPGRLIGGGFAIAQLAGSLAPMVQRIVVDRTGLTGDYDFDLTWTPENMGRGATPPPGAPPFPTVDPNGPSIFTAIQEQWGLKLDAQRGPVEVLVIDWAERPTPD